MRAFFKLLRSFKYAGEGIIFCIRSCRNFRIHTVAAIFVLFLSRFYELSDYEYGLLFLVIGIVLSLECLNTAVEQLCDKITKENSLLIKRAKDTAAAAVLCSSIAAIAVAIRLFYDLTVLKNIVSYFSSPIRLVVLLCSIVTAIIYIFYEDIFKHEK